MRFSEKFLITLFLILLVICSFLLGVFATLEIEKLNESRQKVYVIHDETKQQENNQSVSEIFENANLVPPEFPE